MLRAWSQCVTGVLETRAWGVIDAQQSQHLYFIPSRPLFLSKEVIDRRKKFSKSDHFSGIARQEGGTLVRRGHGQRGEGLGRGRRVEEDPGKHIHKV